MNNSANWRSDVFRGAIVAPGTPAAIILALRAEGHTRYDSPLGGAVLTNAAGSKRRVNHRTAQTVVDDGGTGVMGIRWQRIDGYCCEKTGHATTTYKETKRRTVTQAFAREVGSNQARILAEVVVHLDSNSPEHQSEPTSQSWRKENDIYPIEGGNACCIGQSDLRKCSPGCNSSSN